MEVEGLIGPGDLTKNGLLPMGASQVVFTGDIKKFGNDANRIHEYVGKGSHTLYTASGLNLPQNSHVYGMLIHIQRMPKGNTSYENHITQIYTTSLSSRFSIYTRCGQGNGTTIVWKDWVEVHCNPPR